jgi:DNA polymerase-3 subunit delta
VEPAPVVLVAGGEALLVDRAVERVRRLASERDPELELLTVEAALYEAGQLDTWTSPSLFGEPRLVLVTGVEQASDAFLADALEYLEHAQDDVVLLLRHGGGQRGKKLLDTVRRHPAAVTVTCPSSKDVEKADFKLDFAGQELRDAGASASSAALRAIVDALGGNLRELAAGCAQLAADLVDEQGKPRKIEAADVDRYYGGRSEVTGFKVADAAVAGQRELALGLARHAIDSGVDPVPLVAAIAMKLRTMAKVAGARGSSVDLARDLRLAPWQVDRARRELRDWTPEGLAAGLVALADADLALKGGGRDDVYAVEKAIMTIAAARA